MHSNHWQIDVYTRHHIAELADSYRKCSPISRGEHGLASLVTKLRQRLGISLIRAGWALADNDTMPGRPAAGAQSVNWGTGTGSLGSAL